MRHNKKKIFTAVMCLLLIVTMIVPMLAVVLN